MPTASHAKVSIALLSITGLMVALRLMHVVPTSAVLAVIGAEVLVGVAFVAYALWPLWALRLPASTESVHSTLSPCEQLVPLLSERLPRPVAVTLASEIRNLVAVSAFFRGMWRRVLRRDRTPIEAHGIRVSIWRGPCGLLLPALVVDAVVVVLIMVHIPPAPWRIALDIAGIMGLVWLFSFVASLSVFSHIVSRENVKLRFGSVKWVSICGEVQAVEQHHQMAPPALNHYDGGVFTCSTTGSTNLRITLLDGAVISHGDNAESGRPVKEIRLAVDRPELVSQRFSELVA